MWNRRPKSNRYKRRKRLRHFLNPTIPIMTALTVAGVYFIFGLIGWTGLDNTTPMSAKDALPNIPLGIVVGLIIGYFYQFIKRLQGLDIWVICDTCHRIRLGGVGKPCECGGRFESCEDWEWENEKVEDR